MSKEIGSFIDRNITPYLDLDNAYLEFEKIRLKLEKLFNNSPLSSIAYHSKNHPNTFLKQPVVMALELNPTRYGDPDSTKYQAELIFAPIPTPEGTIIMSALKIPRPRDDERDSTKPKTTIVLMSGGSSQPLPTVAEISKIADTFYKDKNNNVTEVIAIANPLGATQTARKFDHNNMNIAIDATAQFLQTPELHLDNNIILIGFSAGGKCCTDLSAHKDLKDKIKALVLIDPAGMIHTPHIVANLLKDLIKQAIAGHTFKGFGNTLRESMMSAEGIPPNIFAVLYNLFFGDFINQSLAHNLHLQREANSDFQKIYGENSSQAARNIIETPVILVPVVGAEVLNLLVANYGYTSRELKQAILYTADTKRIYADLLNQLFPNVPKKDQYILPYPGFVHFEPIKHMENWKQIKDALVNYI